MGTGDQGEKKAGFTSFGLYYPYIHFRDESWLKMAALYWPRMARVVPPGYRTRDSELAKRLDGELGFVVNLNPATARASTATRFTDLIKNADASVIAQMRVRHDSIDLGESPYLIRRGAPAARAPEKTGSFDPDELQPPALFSLAHYAPDDAFPPGVGLSSGVGLPPGVRVIQPARRMPSSCQVQHLSGTAGSASQAAACSRLPIPLSRRKSAVTPTSGAAAQDDAPRRR
jgi:hypothetical protein